MGVYVSYHFDLYVADTDNDRIQLFKNPHLEGTTILGGNSHVITSLSRPSAVIGDDGGHLFILDRDNHRILHYFSIDGNV